jgi:hypothetical protein
MSYANGTANFNLPQTVASDKRDWSDTNQAFADLDAAVAGTVTDVQTALTNASAAQTTADGAATTAAGAVTTANAASATATSASEQAALASTTANNAVTAAATAQTTADSAVTTANAASATASNADTVALAAQTNIGTMANLQTTDKTSLVAAINEVLSLIGGGGMPDLDYTNPLFTFDTNNLSYTAVEECYLVGSLGETGATLNINNTPIFEYHRAGSTAGNTMSLPVIKLNTGDIVALSAITSTTKLHVFATL